MKKAKQKINIEKEIETMRGEMFQKQEKPGWL